MFNWYAAFTFLHVTAVIVWIGGAVALALVNLRLERESDLGVLRFLSRQSGFLGRAVLAPAALVTLIAGGALAAFLGAGFTLWMGWGLAVLLGSMALGGTLVRRAHEELVVLATVANPDLARLGVLRRRLAALSALNIALLISAVAAMVFKPVI